MADSPTDPDSKGGGGWPGRGPDPGTPRWVKVAGVLVIVVVLLVGVMLLTGIGGDHGPGRHEPAGGGGGHALFSDIAESGGPGGD